MLVPRRRRRWFGLTPAATIEPGLTVYMLAAEGFTAARLSGKLCIAGEADMKSAGEQLMKE